MNRLKKEKNKLFNKMKMSNTSNDLSIYIYNNNNSKYTDSLNLRINNLMESDLKRI